MLLCRIPLSSFIYSYSDLLDDSSLAPLNQRSDRLQLNRLVPLPQPLSLSVWLALAAKCLPYSSSPVFVLLVMKLTTGASHVGRGWGRDSCSQNQLQDSSTLCWLAQSLTALLGKHSDVTRAPNQPRPPWSLHKKKKKSPPIRYEWRRKFD